jgi:hypothetical protein
MEGFKSFIVEKYMSQASKKDRYKASRDYLMLKTQQSKLGKIPNKYKERKGLEGPFMTKSGQVVYYDKKFGQYYNSDTDIYIDYDDWKKMSEDLDEASSAERRKRMQAHLKKTMKKYGDATKMGMDPAQVNQRRNRPTLKKR